MSMPIQTPLGVNTQSELLKNIGLQINPIAKSLIGESKINGQYTFGVLINNTCLKSLTYAINDAYCRGVVPTTPAGTSTYDNLISIGQNVCPILGNSKPSTYDGINDSTSETPTETPTWYNDGYPATTGYGITSSGYASSGTVNTTNINGQGQSAAWLPYNMTNVNNSITQWGFLRCFALQAWNEFNWNGGTKAGGADPLAAVQFKELLSSFDTCAAYLSFNNKSINVVENAPDFLKGVYSNMNDLTTADILGVSLSKDFGTDCITAGKVIDLSKIDKFGLPSVLLQTIYKNHAMTQSLNLALISAELLPDEIISICNESIPFVTKDQEQKIYGSFLVIVGADLNDILVPLNCKIKDLESLADLLNVKKLFPNSYTSLTVPIYNTTQGPTNSKTYYPIFQENSVSPRLNNPSIQEQIGTIIPPGTPPIKSKESRTIVRQVGKGMSRNPIYNGTNKYTQNYLR